MATTTIDDLFTGITLSPASKLAFYDFWQKLYGGNGADPSLVSPEINKLNIQQKIYDAIIAQNTIGKWSGEGYGSPQNNAMAMAGALANAGITRLEDFGRRMVEVSDENGTHKVPEYYNKATGAALSGQDYNVTEDTWGGTFAGKGSTAFNAYFLPNGMPILYTAFGGSSSDWGAVSSALSVLSLVPGIGPFAAAANAIGNAYNGNTTGAIFAALSAVGGFADAAYKDALLTEGLTAEFGLSAADLNAMGLSSSSLSSATLGEVLANVKTAQQGLAVIGALKDRNFSNFVASLASLGPQIGVTIPEDVMKPMQVASIASAVAKGDWTSALGAIGTLKNSNDIKLASAASRVYKAVTSQNPSDIVSSFVGFSKQYDLGSNSLKDVLEKNGYASLVKDADALFKATDTTQALYDAQQKTIADTYKEFLGRTPTQDELINLNLTFDSFDNKIGSIQSLPEAVAYTDKTTVTPAEAQAAAAAEGYTLTADELAKFTGKKDQASTIQAIKSYADPLATTQEEATKFFQDKYGRDPRPEELVPLVGMSEALSTKSIDTSYAGEVKKYDDEFGDYQGAIDKAASLKDKIAYGEAWNGARNLALLEGKDPETAKFSWTNPKTGVTGVYVAQSDDAIQAQLKADQARINLMPVYGGSQNTRTGKPAGQETVYIDTTNGNIVNDDRRYDENGNVISGSIELANNDTKVAALQTAIGSSIRTFLDVGSGLIKGGSGVLETAGTLYGLLGGDMNNVANRTAQSIKDEVEAFRSDEFKANQKLMNDAITKAGGQSQWLAAMETFKQYDTNPIQAAAFIAEQGVSLLIGGGAMAAAKALGAGLTIAEAAALAANTAMQGASVAKSTYDDLIKQGKTEEEAKNAARVAGSLAGVLSVVANKFIPGATSAEQMIATKTAVNTSLKTALAGEMSSEAIDELGGKIVENFATGKPWETDLGTTAVLALIGSGVTTGLVHTAQSALDPVQSTPPSKFEGVTAQEVDGAMKGFSSQGYTPSTTELADIINRNPNATPADIQTSATKYADTHNDVVDQLKSVGVPESKISDIASQVTMEYTFGGGGLESANNILGILENNGIDTKAAVAMASNISGIMTADQVQQIITDTIKANPSMTAAQIQGIVDAAVKDFATTNDIKTAIAGIQFPAGLSKTDVTEAIKGYMKDNPSLTLDQVAGKIADATKGLATNSGVTTAIGDALKGYATTKDIQNAIAGIQFPAGLTPSDVTTAIKNYMTANPGITLDQVAGKIADATKGLATTSGVTTAIGDALKGYATAKDIQTAIANIQFPAGLSSADVTKAITDYMTANPGLSLADVSTKIADATKGLATSSGVTTAISDALKGYATTKDIQSAIANIQFPAGLSKEDVTASIKAYMDANPGITLNQVAGKIADATKGLATTEGVNTAISDALKTQSAAQTAQMTDLKTSLSAAIADAKAFGLQGDAALKSAIDVVAANQNTSAANLLAKLGTTEASLKTDFAMQIAGLDTNLSAAIAQAKAAGLSGDQALQKAIDKVAADQGTNAANLLTQLGTSTANLKNQFSDQISGLDDKLSAAIADAKAFGLSGDAALKSAIDVVAANQNTTREDLLASLNTTEANLKSQFATQISGLDTKLSDAVAAAQAAGLKGDAALQSAIDKVAADQNTSRADLLAQIGTTEATVLAQMKTGMEKVQADIESTKQALQTAIQDAQKAGQQGDVALQAGIDSVASKLGITEEALLSKIGATEASLRTDMAAGLSGVQASIADTKTALESAIADARAAGLSGDQALQSAITKVAADQNTSAENLLSKLGATEASLKTEFATGLAGVQADISNVQKSLQDAMAANEAAGLSRDQAAAKAISDVAASVGTTKEALLAQMGVNEASLRSDLASGLAGVSQNVADVEARIEAAMKANQQAGMDANAALNKAITDVSGALNTTRDDLLSRLGETEQSLQQQLSTGLTDVEQRLNSAMAANEAAGMSRDQALNKAVEDVAASVGSTRADLLAQMGETEQTLRDQFNLGQQQTAAQITGLSQQMQAQYNAMSDAQKAEVAARIQQGQDTTTAINGVQQALTGQIQNLSQQTQQQFAGMSAAQQAEVQARVAQGETLQNAISSVASTLGGQITQVQKDLMAQLGDQGKQLLQSLQQQGVDFSTALQQAVAAQQQQYEAGQQQTTQQIANVQSQLTSAMQANEAAGLSRDQAAAKAIQDIAGSLNTTKEALLAQIGQTEASLQQQLTSGLAGVTQDFQQKYEALSAAQKAQFDAMVEQGQNINTAMQAVQSGLQQQIGELGQTQSQQYQQLSQGQKDLYGQMVAQGVSQSDALNAAVANLSQSQAQQYSQLSQGQKDLFNQMVAQGISQTDALNSAISGVQGQISDVQRNLQQQLAQQSAEVQQQYANMTAAQQSEVQARLAQGNSLQAAIAASQQQTSGQISELAAQTQSQYQALTAAQKAQVDAMMQQGQDLRSALSQVQSGLQQQVTDVESRIGAAMAANEAAGMGRDQALTKAIDDVAASAGQTKVDLLAQLGRTEADLRQDIAANQAQTQSQIAGLSAQAQAQYAAMTAAQQAEVQARVAQGESLQSAITASQQAMQQQLQAAQQQSLAQYNALSAAQKAEADARIAQGQTLQEAIAAAQQTTAGQIAGLSQQTQAQYAAMTAAQQAEVQARVAQGESLQNAIAAAQQATQQQITQTQQQALAQYNALSAAQKAEADARIAQGQTLQEAIAAAQQATAGQIGTLAEQTQQQYNALTAAQKAETDARVAQGQSLQEAIAAAQQNTAGQIAGLSQQTQQQYAALTAAQQAEVQARIQQGQSLQEAIAAAQQATAGQISNLQQSTTDQFNALTAAQKAEVDARVQQGQSLQDAIAAAQQATAGQIGNLQQSTNEQFNALTAAQKAEVDARVQQGQSLQDAIAAAQQATSGQIAGLQQSTNAQFNAMSAAQQAEVQARIQQGQSLQDAITATQQQAAQQAEQLSLQAQQNQAQTVQMFNSLDANQKAEVDARVQQGQDLRTAIESVQTNANTNQAATQAQLDAIRAAQAAAAAKAEEDKLAAAAQAAAEKKAAEEKAAAEKAAAEKKAAEEKAAAARQAQTQSGLSVLQNAAPGGSGTGFGAAAAAISPLVATFLTSKEGKDRFQDPLEAYRRLQSQPLAGENQYGLPTASQQTSQQPQQDAMNTPFYSYGQDSSIDDILGMPASTGTYGYKEGGLATPLFAQGGTTGTRHGKYASGGMASPLVAAGGKMRVDFRHGDAVTGEGDGQSDDIPAMLADGEFVFPADVVAAIGNGSTKAGSDKLYDMMHGIRAHVRSAKPEDLPPEIKSPLAFLKSKKARK